MRNAVICTVLICILVLTGATIYSIEGKTTRQNELDANLSSAMERSMEIMTIDPTYTISREDDQHLIADFIQNFLVRMNSNSEFQIDILGVDAEKGMLSVRATEIFPSLFSKSTVSATRTIILEDYENTEEEYFEVTFYEECNNGVCEGALKQVHVYGGSTLENLNPANSVKDGYSFQGWRLALLNEATGKYEVVSKVYNDFSEVFVTENLKFIAAWEEDAEDIFTVTFYANNQVHEVIKIKDGSIIGNHKAVPVKEGYTFKGWSNVQNDLLTDAEVSNKVINSHTKFTAVFEKN